MSLKPVEVTPATELFTHSLQRAMTRPDGHTHVIGWLIGPGECPKRCLSRLDVGVGQFETVEPAARQEE